MKRKLFWASGITLAYAYLGFPALVLLRAALRPRPYHEADIEPSVTVVIAAHNEARVIQDKVTNLAAVDYPADRLEIVIASDGSDDGTPRLAREAGGNRVHVLDLPRVGKAAALKQALAKATGEVIVFSDANSMFDPNAIRVLVRPFADPEVGGVAGNQVYSRSAGGDSSTLGERGYWDLDRLLKVAQSKSGSVTGATGAIYAVRSALVDEIRDDVNDDFFISLGVIARGYRLVFAPGAVAYEDVTASVAETFARRVRVMVRGLRCVAVQPRLLDPRRHGFFSVQLVSHKVVPRLAAFPLAVLAVSSALLFRRGKMYRTAAAGQAAFYGLGLVGIAFARRPWSRRKLLALPAFFCLVNAASVVAVWHLLSGKSFARWQPGRRGEEVSGRDRRGRPD